MVRFDASKLPSGWAIKCVSMDVWVLTIQVAKEVPGQPAASASLDVNIDPWKSRALHQNDWASFCASLR